MNPTYTKTTYKTETHTIIETHNEYGELLCVEVCDINTGNATNVYSGLKAQAGHYEWIDCQTTAYIGKVYY